MRVAIIGGSGGIGAALVDALRAADDIESIHATFHRTEPASLVPQERAGGNSMSWSQLDVTDESAVANWADAVGDIDWLINAAGLLHEPDHLPEKTVRDIDPEFFRRNMDINCLPTLLLAKHAGQCLKQSDCGVFATISAKVGSISDNRLGGWVSYRASKAALNMSLKCIAIEWQRTQKKTRVLALHPGTTATALSVPFQKNVPADKLFSPARTAALLLQQIRQAHDHASGRFVTYDGQELPW